MSFSYSINSFIEVVKTLITECLFHLGKKIPALMERAGIAYEKELYETIINSKVGFYSFPSHFSTHTSFS